MLDVGPILAVSECSANDNSTYWVPYYNYSPSTWFYSVYILSHLECFWSDFWIMEHTKCFTKAIYIIE